MKAERVEKEDGRYLIFFSFEDEAGAAEPAPAESQPPPGADEGRSPESQI